MEAVEAVVEEAAAAVDTAPRYAGAPVRDPYRAFPMLSRPPMYGRNAGGR